MKDVIFIYADGCKDCLRMRSIIEKYSDSINLIESESEGENAINLAIDYDIEDLPGCNIGGVVFQGEKFSSKKFEKSLKRYLNQ